MFTGTVEAQSHEGGLLVHFEGSSPALNAIMVRADDGTYIGKVDGVIGSTNHPLAHVAHIDRSLDMEALIGVNVTVRAKQKPKEQRNERRENARGDERRGQRRDNNRGFRNDRGGRDNNRGFRNDRGGRDNNRGSFNDNDWTCPECKNSNFAFRNVCNRCEAPRPGGGGHRREHNNRSGRDNNRGFRNDRGGRDNNRGFRNDRGGRDNQGGGRQQRGTFNNNDWTCPKCNNSNFSFRNVCNRCEEPRPGGGGGRSDRRQPSRGYPSRDNQRRGYEGGQQRGRPQQGRGGSRPQQRRASDVQPRRARGKRSGHAHNQPPRDFRSPRKFERRDD